MNFEQEIEEWINIDNEMKKTVEYIKFGHDFNQIFNNDDDKYPNIKKLEFGHDFNQVININNFQLLEDLKFDHNFNQSLTNIKFPSSLLKLTLYHYLLLIYNIHYFFLKKVQLLYF